MSLLTDFLKLFKYDPETDRDKTFNITQALNENWDKIDADKKAQDDAIATKETPAGAQQKADAAEGNAKSYTDQHELKAAPHSGHETPAGAQGKANAAETNAKAYTDQEVANVENDLATHKADDASTTTKGHVQLNDTVTSTSTTQAATANAVKTAYDKGNHSHPYAPSTHTHTKSQVGLGNVENYRQARSAQGYTIVKDGTDGTGIINFKTS